MYRVRERGMRGTGLDSPHFESLLDALLREMARPFQSAACCNAKDLLRAIQQLLAAAILWPIKI